MPKRSLFILGMCIMALGTSSCFLSPDESKKEPPPPPEPYGDLSVKEHVLRNVQKAYNDRNVTKYDEVLDVDFTFFFSPGDVAGGEVPEQWGRADEVASAAGLFCRSGCDPQLPVCRSIRMDLQYESGVQWVEVVPAAFPSETWYTTTVFYDFTIEIDPDLTLIPQSGAKAQFTVRNTGTAEKPLWKLVEFRDLGGT